MKKFVYLTASALLLPVLLFATDVSAQRKNYTSHDVKPLNRPVNDMPGGENPIADGMNMKQDATMPNCPCTKAADETDCPCARKAKKASKHADKNKKHDKQKGLKKHSKLQEQIDEVNDNYDEAVEKISKSDFNQQQKDLLIRQARENRDFATIKIKTDAHLRYCHKKERKELGIDKKDLDKEVNKKALKAVDKIN